MRRRRLHLHARLQQQQQQMAHMSRARCMPQVPLRPAAHGIALLPLARRLCRRPQDRCTSGASVSARRRAMPHLPPRVCNQQRSLPFPCLCTRPRWRQNAVTPPRPHLVIPSCLVAAPHPPSSLSAASLRLQPCRLHVRVHRPRTACRTLASSIAACVCQAAATYSRRAAATCDPGHHSTSSSSSPRGRSRLS